MENIISYIQHLEKSIQNAEDGISKIDDFIKNMIGMTGRKTRHFYNNLLNYPDARYLEIGTWAGSSFCSALCGNKAVKALGIDNMEGYGNVIDLLKHNFSLYKGENNASILEEDCFKVNVKNIGKYNMFLYDGEHSYESHYKALTHYYDCLDDVFIFIVDDWNWKDPRKGTFNSIIDLDLEVLWSKEIRLTNDGSSTPNQFIHSTWWNGIGIFLLKKYPKNKLYNGIGERIK
jgi:hypothetical protein